MAILICHYLLPGKDSIYKEIKIISAILVAQLPLHGKVSTKVAKPVHHSMGESIVINTKHILLKRKKKIFEKIS